MRASGHLLDAGLLPQTLALVPKSCCRCVGECPLPSLVSHRSVNLDPVPFFLLFFLFALHLQPGLALLFGPPTGLRSSVRGCAGDLQADISEPAGFWQQVGRCQAGDSKLQDYIDKPWTETCEKSLGKSSPHGIRTGIPSSTRHAHGQATAACSGIGRDRLAHAATKSLLC